MELLSILKRENIEITVIAVVFIVLIFLVLKDFKLTSKKSWGLLLGLTALGGIIAIKAIAKRRLLQELEERENQLEEIEKRYSDMKDNNQILEDDYNKLKAELERVKQESRKAIMEADARIEAARKERENPENITKEEVYEFLNSYK
ncbi:MAG TPA: hypothetical protein PLH91_08185 [Tenuifilaceae bacterium]|nr:hypothetical protein [Tenuifilaceae bacterium]HPI45196.1 hypothetical protein [Tenuifilaceae bacterium]HPN20866.1 hypothetical protein [Tenuifilaceae bacterium]HPV57152.1 hypothetical protein [Tenuifilaceae bacterium]